MKKNLLTILLFVNLGFCIGQPFTKKYIMAFHTCASGACAGPSQHQTYLAESNDGATWTLVPNYTTYLGSVPDLVTRGNKLYIYNPGKVTRYDKTTNTWSAATTVSVTLSSVTQNYVDPSPILDANNKIVLFYLNSTGLSGDPATCSSYPCTKYFDSAIEVDGSDGTQFTQQAGHRYQVTINSGTASDPDIFTNGSTYYLYISRGNNTSVHTSTSLHGTYTDVSGLTNSYITTQGGIPAGIWDGTQFQTFVHANVGSTVIRRQAHAGFTSQLNSMSTIITGNGFGFGSNSTAESPGVTENGFLTLPINMISFDAVKKENSVVLKWKTAASSRPVFFDIERMNNGGNFESIGTKNGTIEPTETEYSFTDYSLIDGNCFYRIKQTDANGEISYTKVIMIDLKTIIKPILSITPSFVQQNINMQYKSYKTETVKWVVTDVTGKTLLNQNWQTEAGIMAKNIDVTNLKTGVYFLSLFTQGQTLTQKFVKQ